MVQRHDTRRVEAATGDHPSRNAHLWFGSVHPFEDGNGRIGRAIAEKALAQTIEAPTLRALAETINRPARIITLNCSTPATPTTSTVGWRGSRISFWKHSNGLSLASVS
ncbi:Fic family protein [Hephaestia sp. GCM10023244]|uniref:Fic family protein n=1 Tax=unclassified Hephaestia TaxID=2631281 RepID=UPI00336BBBD4